MEAHGTALRRHRLLWANGLMDVMYMDDALRQMLCNQTISAGELKEKGDQQFYATLRKIGMQKVIEGQTCLKEIKRVTSQL